MEDLREVLQHSFSDAYFLLQYLSCFSSPPTTNYGLWKTARFNSAGSLALIVSAVLLLLSGFQLLCTVVYGNRAGLRQSEQIRHGYAIQSLVCAGQWVGDGIRGHLAIVGRVQKNQIVCRAQTAGVKRFVEQCSGRSEERGWRCETATSWWIYIRRGLGLSSL